MANSEDEEFLNSDIMTIDLKILNKLLEILDTEDKWKCLLAELPIDISRTISKGKLERERFNHMSSPAKLLLQELSTRGGIVKDLIIWMENIDVIDALLLIKPDELLVIIEEPPEAVEIQASENSILRLRCIADGFPKPCYQWYKDDNELITQQDSSLIISPVNLNDAGVYYCRVAKHNRLTDGEDFILSQETDVTVKPGCHVEKSIKEFSHDTDQPRIVEEPICPSQNKIVQGSSFTLSCKGRSKHAVYYQWFCNGLQMSGETSSELHLSNLYPVEGQFQWYYQCAVTNDYGTALSDRVIVELDVIQENTQYFAEDKVALLIANQNYVKLIPLCLPSSDVKTVSQLLTELNFRVLSFLNLNLVEMRNAVELFCQQLSKGAYGILFYAGHGFEQFGQSYFQPVDASSDYSIDECLCTEYVLKRMQETNPALCLFMVDACRNLPPEETWVNNIPTPGIIYEPKMARNVLFSYSTSPYCSAYEVSDQENGPYVQLLKKHLKKKLPIVDILLTVQSEMELARYHPLINQREQFPWTGGNLAQKLTLHDVVLGSSPNYQHLVEEWKNLAVLPSPREIDIHDSSKYKIKFDFQLHRSTFWNGLDIDILFEQVPKYLDFEIFITNDEVLGFVKTCSSEHTIVEVVNLQKLKTELHCILRCVDKNMNSSYDVATLDLGYPLVSKKILWRNSLSRKHGDERQSSSKAFPMANDLIDLS